MIRAHKIRLYPNNHQESLLVKSCGVARFAYNWALMEWYTQYLSGEKPTESNLRKQLNSIKKEQFPWMREVTKSAPQQAIKNLGEAFQNTFDKIKNGKKLGKRKKKKRKKSENEKENLISYLLDKPGFPKLKKKGINEKFRADNGSIDGIQDAIKVTDTHVWLPKIGWVRINEKVRFLGNIVSATVSKKSNQWFVSISVETKEVLEGKLNGVVGVDLGIKSLAVLSTGEVIEGPKAHKSVLNRIKRLNRSLSRKQLGSANRKKAKTKLSRLHLRVFNVRQDSLHKLTHKLTTEFKIVCIEDLNVQGMLKNHHLARAIADAGFSEFRRQLEYKSSMTGTQIVVANRWFPSTKRCCKCNQIHEMPLSKRIMECSCGNVMDRDLNSANNLEIYAESSPVLVCGEESSGTTVRGCVKLSSRKQKSSIKSMRVGLNKS